MVQVDISQLTAECNGWREKLRQYREEFTRDEASLQQVARQALDKDQLKDVEHLHNQFHIQLINIHDLKQSIKLHERQLQNDSPATEDSANTHETLLDEFRSLEQTLQQLRSEFGGFLSRTS
jgi:phage shock protein A